jgi:hypothetical protein
MSVDTEPIGAEASIICAAEDALSHARVLVKSWSVGYYLYTKVFNQANFLP